LAGGGAAARLWRRFGILLATKDEELEDAALDLARAVAASGGAPAARLSRRDARREERQREERWSEAGQGTSRIPPGSWSGRGSSRSSGSAKCRRAARARRSTSCPQPPATVACVPLSPRGAGRAAGGLRRAFSDLSSSSSRTKLRGTITTSPDWPAMAIPTMATQGVGTACSWHGRGRPRGPLDSAAIHKQPGSGRESVRQNVSSQQGGQGASLGAARARGAL